MLLLCKAKLFHNHVSFYELYDDIPAEGRMTWSDIDLTDPWDSKSKNDQNSLISIVSHTLIGLNEEQMGNLA